MRLTAGSDNLALVHSSEHLPTGSCETVATPFHRDNKAARLLLDETGLIDATPAALGLFGIENIETLRAVGLSGINADARACPKRLQRLILQTLNRSHGYKPRLVRWHCRGLGTAPFVAEIIFSSCTHHNRQALQADIRILRNSARENSLLNRLSGKLTGRVSPDRSGKSFRHLHAELNALRNSERALIEQGEYFRQLFEAAPLGIVLLDQQERIRNANQHWLEMFGYELTEVAGQCINDLIVPPASRKEANEISRRILRDEVVEFHTRRQRKDGRLIDISFLGKPVSVAGGAQGIYGIYTDKSDVIAREKAFFAQKELAELTLNSISDAVLRVEDSSRITYMNQAAEHLLCISASESIGKRLDEVARFVTEHDGREISFEAVQRDTDYFTLQEDARLIRKDGSSVSVEGEITPFYERGDDELRCGGVVVLRDITERREVQQALAYKAAHDSLTGLVNRAEIERRIGCAIDKAKSQGINSCLLYIDLDQFKVVNDTCGHQAGDRLLKRVARTMLFALGDSIMLARLGGDEFALLLEDTSTGEARDCAELIIRSIQEIRFTWDNKLFRIGASVGIAEINARSESIDRVLAMADSACYAAKDQGRGRTRLAHDNDAQFTQRRSEMDWVTRINDALENNLFQLHRQRIAPIAESNRGEIHWEVLIRMLAHDGSIIPPNQFIPAAERYGLMPSIDRWVIENVFRKISELPGGHSASDDIISINLSGTSLGDDRFSGFLEGVFNKYSITPGKICFEITETAAAANFESALSFMNYIHNLGCKISLDDFGSGFSSFTYLKSFRIDYLKIDGSFVRNIDTDKVNSVFVESINRIGKSLGILTVAEYVETGEALTKLRELGVDFAQGRFVAPPGVWQ